MDIKQGRIRYVIGNGNSISLWHDNWHPLGPLFRHYGRRVVFNLGRYLAAKVGSITKDGDWKWPTVWKPVIQEIMDNIPEDLKPPVYKEDEVRWIACWEWSFSSRSGWEALRNTSCLVRWYKVVCFKHNVPRWAAVQKKLFQGGQWSFGWHVTVEWELSLIPLVCYVKAIMKSTLTYFLLAPSLDTYWPNLLEQCRVFRRPIGFDQELETWNGMIQGGSHGFVSNSFKFFLQPSTTLGGKAETELKRGGKVACGTHKSKKRENIFVLQEQCHSSKCMYYFGIKNFDEWLIDESV